MRSLYKIIFLFVLVNTSCALNAKNNSSDNNLASPSATISGTTTVCQNAAQPIITFTGSGGTAPYTFTYTVTGVAENQTIATTSGNSVTVSVPTGTVGIFNYTLISVHDAANPSPEQPSTGIATVTVSAPPVVDFTFTNDNSCSGTAIQFTSSVTGAATYTYSWNFGDSTTSTQQNPSHTFTSLGCGTATFSVTLTVTGGGCAVTTTKTITVKQKPDINFEDKNPSATPSTQFNNCATASISNTSYTITVGNISVSTCITSYSIDWGDGSTENNVIFPKTHNYPQLGTYNMIITAIGNNGCSNSQTYIVKNISNPSGGILNPGGSTDMCIPTPIIQYTIGNWATNSPGTTYAIDYGDGSTILNLNQDDMVKTSYYNSTTPSLSTNYPVPYSYNKNSCPNDFIIKLTVSNACKSTIGTVVGGNTISNAKPNFTAPLSACSTTNVLFTNTSILGYSANCTRDTKFSWDFGDPASGASNTINSGFVTTAPNVNHIFSGPGIYTVTLIANSGGTCNISPPITKTICIEAPLVPAFTLSNTVGCSPQSIAATNTTVTTNSCTTPTYVWNITYIPAYCGTSITSIPNQTTTNATYNFTEPGTYTIKLTATNSCGSFSTSQAVTVKKPPTVTLNNITDFCQSSSLTPIANISTCTNGTSTYLWSFPGGTPSSATSAIPPSVSYATAGNHTITLAVTNECGTTTATSNTFAVLSAPTVQNETVTVCSGVSFSVTPSNSTAGNIIPVGTTYSWPTPIVTGGMTGGIAGTNQTSISGTLNNPTSSVQTATYNVTPKIGTCSVNPFTVIVTVNPAAQVNQPTPVSVCNGATTAAINFTTTNPSGTTFSWTNSTPSIGLAISGNGNIPSFTAVNTTNAPIIATIVVTPSFSGGSATCSGVSKTFTITVNPTGQVNQPTSLTKCNGEVVVTSFLTSNTGETTYNWTNDTPAIGLPAIGTGNISFTATNSTSNPLVATITVTPTYNNGSSNCIGTSKTFTITINPSAQVNQPTAISVCNGNTIPTTTFSTLNTSGTTTYAWTNSNTAIGLGAFGTGDIPSFTATNTGNSVLTATIIVTPSYLVGATSCTGSTKQFTITVSPNASVNTTIDKVICNGSNSPSITFTSTNTGGTTSYSWTNSNTAIGLSASGTGNIPVFTATNTGLVPITANISVTPSFTNGSLVCTGTTQTFTITVNPSAQVNSINNIEVCNGNSIASTVLSTNNSGGTTTYSWTNSNTNIGLAATGNGNIPTFTANNTGSTPIIATITILPVYTNAGVSCNGTNQTFTIKVNPSPVAIISGSVDVCLNATNPQITFTGSFGNAPYTFTYNLNDGTNQTISTTSGNSVSINAPTNVLGIFTYNLVNVQDSNATSCLNTISQSAIVTVNNAPTIDVQPLPTQSICVGGTIANPLTVTYSNGTGTPTYQWYSNSSNTTTGGNPVGTNLPNYTPPVFNTAGTFYYYVVISFSGNGCGSITSAVAEIVVVSDPIVSSQPLPTQTLCQNVIPATLSVTVSGGIGTSYFYQWYSTTANNNTSGTIIADATNAAFTPPTTNVGTMYYYCIITQTNGLDCNVTSATATVVVNLAPVIATQPASSTICIGQTPTLLSVSYVNGVGTPQYQWYSNTTNTVTGGTLIAGATNDNYNPQNSTFGTTYYYCVITFSSGGCSNITSNIAEVIVNENPIIASQSPIICSATSFTVTPNNSNGDIVPTGTTYTWTNPTINPVGSITGASAQGTPQNTISQTLINTTTSPATVTYTVTPTSGVCVGNNFTITVTVNPSINPNVVANNNTCFGVNTASITTNITGGIPPYMITWTGPGIFTSSATSIFNLLPGVYNVTIDDAGGCPFTNSYTITEPTDILITTDTNSNVTCFNDANGEIKITITGGTIPYNYNWTKNGIPYATTEDLPNLSPGIYAVTVSDANNCGPKTATFTITEPPILAVNLVSKTNVLCYGQPSGAITVNVIGGTSPYAYAWTGLNGFTSANQNLTNVFAGTYNLIATDNSGCAKNLSVILTQTPEILITATTTPIICYGDNNGSISIVISGGIAPYQITWSNLGSGTFQNNLSAGDYTITVTDALNCTKTVTVNIPEAPIFTVNPVVKNISCFGANNGSITLNFVGGIAPVTLTWNDGAVTGTTRNNLKPGSYTVTIVDSKPCTITRTFIILEPQLLVLSANLTNAFDCDNANSGAINLLVSGGSAPFTYAWSNGATTEDLVNIPAGNYLVTVTDANGCSKQAQYSINRPPPIVTGVVTKTDFDCETKYVKQTFVAQVSGGVPPYQVVWSSGTVSGANNEMMNTTQNGTVILTATDAIGCKSNYTFTVAIPTLGSPSFTSSSYAYSTFGTYSINDPIQFTNTATGDYISMIWNFGDGVTSTELNPVHTFTNPKDYVVTQTVTYPFGCVYIQKITLIVTKGYVLVVPNAFTPNNDTLNDTFRPVTKGLKNVRLDVYDTWGSMIYSESGEILRGWDGKIKGANAENGNYYCKVSGETFYGIIVNENHPFVLIK